MTGDPGIQPDQSAAAPAGTDAHQQSLDRIRQVYQGRIQRRDEADARDPRRGERTDRIKAGDYRRLLSRNGLIPLNSRDILDVGCQWGTWLARCRQEWGHRDGRLCGIELMDQWVARGRDTYGFVDLRCGSADQLPWPDDSFDLVHQAMLFSSVPDGDLRGAIAAEMRRVLRPGGHVLWYDFFFNPVNPDTVGMTLSRVRALFPGWRVADRARVTLAPPLARILRRVWEPAVDVLSKARILNFHYLVLLDKPR